MTKGSGQGKGKHIARPKHPGREMLVWVLEKKGEARAYFQAGNMAGRTKQEVKAFKANSKAFTNYGVDYDPTKYREEGHPNASTASQIQTRKTLIRNGFLTAHPETGHCRYLDLTDEGERLAEFLKQNGLCSPDEVERAVRRSSRYERVYASLFSNPIKRGEVPLGKKRDEMEDRQFYHLAMANLKEEECRAYLASLPPEMTRLEVERIRNTPFDGTPMVFLPPFPPLEFAFTDTASEVVDESQESNTPKKLVN